MIYLLLYTGLCYMAYWCYSSITAFMFNLFIDEVIIKMLLINPDKLIICTSCVWNSGEERESTDIVFLVSFYFILLKQFWFYT